MENMWGTRDLKLKTKQLKTSQVLILAVPDIWWTCCKESWCSQSECNLSSTGVQYSTYICIQMLLWSQYLWSGFHLCIPNVQVSFRMDFH